MTKFDKLSKGKICSEVQFYRVEKVVGDKVQLMNDKNDPIVVDKKYVESCLQSADQFTSEKKVTMTEAATLFLENSNVALMVSFNKKVKPEDVVKEIMEAYSSSTPKEIENKVKKAVKEALNGVERIMSGRHYGTINDLGRVNFVDMEETITPGKDYDSRLKQVDPRTINFFIARGIKYTVK